jgi:hypothetical protein
MGMGKAGGEVECREVAGIETDGGTEAPGCGGKQTGVDGAPTGCTQVSLLTGGGLRGTRTRLILHYCTKGL